jgi:hypothetical protein
VIEANPNVIAARVEQRDQNKMFVLFDFSPCRIYIKFNERLCAISSSSPRTKLLSVSFRRLSRRNGPRGQPAFFISASNSSHQILTPSGAPS